MTTHAAPHPAAPSPDAPASETGFATRALAVVEGQLALLSALAEVGVAMAADLSRRVQAEPRPDLARAALALDRLSRAVRLCILLQSKLIGQATALERAEVAAPRAVPPGMALTHLAEAAFALDEDSDAADERLEEAMEQVEVLEREFAERGERLDSDDLQRLVDSQPFDTLVALICADLGLPPTPSPSSPKRCARRGAAAAAPAPPASPSRP